MSKTHIYHPEIIVGFILFLVIVVSTLMQIPRFEDYSIKYSIYNITVSSREDQAWFEKKPAIKTYYIQFFKGNELHSVTVDALETPIVIDDSLYLEELHREAYNRYLVWQVKTWDQVLHYKIHVPSIPEATVKITGDIIN